MQPGRGALGDLVAVTRDRGFDRRSIAKSSRGGHRHGTQHPDRILLEPLGRIADAPNDPGLQIVESARVIDDRECRDVVEERVDREVSSESVFFGGAERVVAMEETGMAVHVAAVRGRLARRRLRVGGGQALRPRASV